MRREFFGIGVALAVAGAAVPGVASADVEIVAEPVNAYSADTYTMDQSEPLTFRNNDGNRHDVTARDLGADGAPLFATPTITSGQTAFVEGSQYLTTGSYRFFCTVHPILMNATLQVTANGTPAPRSVGPGGTGPADTVQPTVRLRVLDQSMRRVRRAGRVRTSVRMSKAAQVTLVLTLRDGRRIVRLARSRVSFRGAGTRRVALRLSRTGRRALARRSRAALRLTAQARDSAGNRSRTATARRTLR